MQTNLLSKTAPSSFTSLTSGLGGTYSSIKLNSIYQTNPLCYVASKANS